MKRGGKLAVRRRGRKGTQHSRAVRYIEWAKVASSKSSRVSAVKQVPRTAKRTAVRLGTAITVSKAAAATTAAAGGRPRGTCQIEWNARSACTAAVCSGRVVERKRERGRRTREEDRARPGGLLKIKTLPHECSRLAAGRSLSSAWRGCRSPHPNLGLSLSPCRLHWMKLIMCHWIRILQPSNLCLGTAQCAF